MSGSILNQFRVYSGDPVAPQSVPLHGQDFAASVRTQASAFRQEQSEAERCSSSSKQQSLLPVSELRIIMSCREMSSLSVSVSAYYAFVW